VYANPPADVAPRSSERLGCCSFPENPPPRFLRRLSHRFTHISLVYHCARTCAPYPISKRRRGVGQPVAGMSALRARISFACSCMIIHVRKTNHLGSKQESFTLQKGGRACMQRRHLSCLWQPLFRMHRGQIGTMEQPRRHESRQERSFRLDRAVRLDAFAT
jgi:hypothetical protein